MKTIAPYVNQIVQGDCLNIMENFPDGCIDFIICDLPYGTTQNPWDQIIDFGRLWQCYKRIIKPNGAIALTGHGLFTAKLIMSNPDWYRYKIVWIKSKAPNFLQANRQPMKKHEDVCIFYQKQPVYHPQMTVSNPYNKGLRKPTLTGSYGNFHPSVRISKGERYPNDCIFFEEPKEDWVYCKTAEGEGHVFHPNQKPVALGQYLIRTFTDPDQIVLDNAAGSGSFLVAAAREGRRFIGIEKNEHARRLKTEHTNFIEACRERLAGEIK
jgi:site-specific DNA-methyltransferase (adenine-specific)